MRVLKDIVFAVLVASALLGVLGSAIILCERWGKRNEEERASVSQKMIDERLEPLKKIVVELERRILELERRPK